MNRLEREALRRRLDRIEAKLVEMGLIKPDSKPKPGGKVDSPKVETIRKGVKWERNV